MFFFSEAGIISESESVRFRNNFTHIFQKIKKPIILFENIPTIIRAIKENYEPEEYFVYLTEGMERVSPNGLYYEWYKNGKRLFEQFLNPEKLFFINYSNTFRIYEILFDMGFKEFNTFFSKMKHRSQF